MAFWWFGSKRMAEIVKAQQDALGAVAIEFQSVMKQAVSKSGTGRMYARATRTHQASAPGMAPTVDTGDYRRSIQVDLSKQRAATPEVRIGTKSRKGPWLEFGTLKMAARPHWIPEFRKFSPAIQKKMADFIKRRLAAMK